MLLCSGFTDTGSPLPRSRHSTALHGLSKDSCERDSFSLGSPRDLSSALRREGSRKLVFLSSFDWLLVLLMEPFRRLLKNPGTLKGEVFAVSIELGFSDVLVPEILRLRGDLSAGTSGKEKRNIIKNPNLGLFH